MPNAFIFLCSRATQQKCFDLKLFGGGKDYEKVIKQVKKGDTLFLYNFTTNQLHGTFVAKSDSARDIIPTAWGGRFPFQVRQDWIKKYNPLSLYEFEHIAYVRDKFPKPSLTSSETNSLIGLFKLSFRLPAYEVKYLGKNPRKYKTKDGHVVRSAGELLIDNWLHKKRITHSYDIKVDIDEPILCDFLIPLPNRPEKQGVYIEFWGMQETGYLKRKAYKKQLYKKYNFTLINLESTHLPKLNKVLSEKLSILTK